MAFQKSTKQDTSKAEAKPAPKSTLTIPISLNDWDLDIRWENDAHTVAFASLERGGYQKYHVKLFNNALDALEDEVMEYRLSIQNGQNAQKQWEVQLILNPV